MSHPPISPPVRLWAFVIMLGLFSAQHVSAITVTREVGELSPDISAELHVNQAARFEFSELMQEALSIAVADVAAVSPGILATAKVPLGRLEYFTTLSVNMPVVSLTGDYTSADNQQSGMEEGFQTSHIKAAGGLTIVTSNMVNLLDGRLVRNAASRGGWLQISNFEVDLAREVVLADVVGANGAGSRTGFTMWQLNGLPLLMTSPLQGCADSAPIHCVGTLSTNATFDSLMLDSGADDFVATALGLTDFGKAVFSNGAIWGDLVVGVPEPTTWLTMVLGMVGIGLMHRRRRATTH